MYEAYYDPAPRVARDPHGDLEAFLFEHGVCRPGLDDPNITESIVALDCSCSAALTVTLPPRPARR